MEQGALQDGLQQGELLLRRCLSSFPQFGLQPLHSLQGTLRICGEFIQYECVRKGNVVLSLQRENLGDAEASAAQITV